MPEQLTRFSPDAMRSRRKAQQVARQHLAVALDVTPDTIGKYERGETVPTVNTALGIARYLKCELGDLFENASA